MNKDEALKLAIEALQLPHPGVRTDFSDALTYREKIKTAIDKGKAALAQECNFCPRCGKRLASGFVEISIHTCTPPQEKNT